MWYSLNALLIWKLVKTGANLDICELSLFVLPYVAANIFLVKLAGLDRYGQATWCFLDFSPGCDSTSISSPTTAESLSPPC